MRLPFFEHLSIENYRLYPGENSENPLEIPLTAGPLIVLGVNGLGKSTLLLLMKHLLTGAVRLRDAGFTGERSDVVKLDKNFFADRVSDQAKAAKAKIQVKFGTSTLHVSRQLSDLALVEASLETKSQCDKVTNEKDYQDLLASAMGVADFEDALRILNRVTFYLENKDSLIWDVAAQFELFRAILTREISHDLRQLESEIVSSDSSFRNLRATLGKLTKKRDHELLKNEKSATTKAHLAKATAEYDVEERRVIDLIDEVDQWSQRRSDDRIELKRADLAADKAAQTYEQIKFNALRHAFAGVSPNEQYVFLKLISDRVCQSCGTEAEEAAQRIEKRQERNECLVCGSQRVDTSNITTTSAKIQKKAKNAFLALQDARQTRDDTHTKFLESCDGVSSTAAELEIAREKADLAKSNIRKLMANLPDGDKVELEARTSRIEGLREDLLSFQSDRDEAEEKIQNLLSFLKTATEDISEQLVANFRKRAKAFFAEDVRLVYAPRVSRIGQEGRKFDFPAFEVEMTSSATEGHFVRRKADQVSLSQREYLDVIFRMSLIETFGSAGCSMVVDGPEGSIDAVFAERAGDLFSNFSRQNSGNTALLACNVVEGGFIPNCLRDFPKYADKKKRVINLIELGTPTAALIELHAEYDQKVVTILKTKAR